MNRLILFIFGVFFVASLNAQVITLSPKKPALNEEVTLTFDAKAGNGALADHKGDVYAHAGLITNESSHENDWKKVVSDWGDNQEKLKFTRVSENKYELKFKISELYGIPATGGNVVALAFVFRNEDGSKVAKDKGEKDILYFFKKAHFKKPPETLKESLTKTPNWSNYASIYEVNIRQYTKEGTFNAFSEHLPRLKDMGMDILWIMPIQPIGVKKRKGGLGSYYSIQDYKGINPNYGTLDDFKALVNKAHGMGMKVVLDWVANHSSWDNAWIDQHPKWYSRDDKGEIIAPYDWTDVADLNYEMYYMREAMTDAMLYWIKEVDLDGFRCDVAGEVPLDFWEDTRAKLDREKEIWMIAEDGSQYWLLNRAFNANYGWHFHHLMNEVAKGHTNANDLISHFSDIKKNYPKGTYPMQFITNHDENSWAGTVNERLGEGHKAFAVLTFTVPGMPLIYSGQEAGLKKRLKFFEKDLIDWSDLSLMPFYTKLNQLKAENPALWNGAAGGDLRQITTDQPKSVVAFSRETKKNKVLTIINLSKKDQSFTLPAGKDEGIYRDYFTGEEVIIAKRGKMTLKAWEYRVLIFEKENPNAKRTFQSIEKGKTGLKIYTSDGTIVLTPYSPHSIEVEFIGIDEINPLSNAIAKPPQPIKTLVTDNDNTIIYNTYGIEVTITKEPFHIDFFYKNKKLLSEEKGFFDNGDVRGFRFQLNENEKLTGGGERALGMNRRGKRLQLYNKASYGYEETANLMYYSMPIAISSEKYMLVFDNGASGYMDLGATEKNVLQFEAVGGRMSYLLIAGENWHQLTNNFADLTGHQPMLPRWALGNIASRMGYHTQKEVENVVAKYQKEDIPLDAVVLDLFWFGSDIKGGLGNLDWYKTNFPKPIEMMLNFKKQGVNTILITEPFIVENTRTYKEVIEKELVGKNEAGAPYLYDFYFGKTTLLDIFKPEAQEWFWDIYKKHTETGVAGWWGDLGEPEVHPDDLIHINGKAKDLHNLYGHEWSKTVFEGFEKDFPSTRPVILMRSGFVGSQRYGLVPWSGDVNRSWGGLKSQVEILLTMSLQGLGYMHSDLGGFAGNYKDAELYTRWLQYGVFQPIYRTHGQESVPSEPIFWDEKTKDIARKYIKFRYELLPYLYTASFMNFRFGTPIMTPLFFIDDNPDLFDNTSEYLWGSDFLIAPVVEKGAKAQSIYFPKGHQWIDYWTGEIHKGGSTAEIPVTIENIPVFVRAGAFIPMVEAVQSTKDYSTKNLSVHYYHDKSVSGDIGFFYNDDGFSKDAYTKEAYETIEFESEYTEEEGLIIDLKPTINQFKRKFEDRTINLIIHGWDKEPSSVLINDEKTKLNWDQTKKEVEVSFILKTERINIQVKQ